MVSVKKQNRLANSADPDEMALYDPYQDLHCLQNIVLVCRAERANIHWNLNNSKSKGPNSFV